MRFAELTAVTITPPESSSAFECAQVEMHGTQDLSHDPFASLSVVSLRCPVAAQNAGLQPAPRSLFVRLCNFNIPQVNVTVACVWGNRTCLAAMFNHPV
jgi:hypothetical protein